MEKTVGFRVSEKLYNWIAKEAEKKDRSVSSYVRRLVLKEKKKHSKKEKKK